MAANEITRESERTQIKPNRRTFGKAVLAGILAGPAAMSSITQAATSSRSGAGDKGMKLALMLGPEDEERWILARQIGVNHAIVSLSRVLNRTKPEQYLDTLTKIKAAYEASGLTIAGVESHPVAAEKIKLGRR